MLLEQSSHSRIASLKYRLTSLSSLGTRAKTCKSCQNDAEMFKSCRSSSKLCERMCAFCLGSKERISRCSFVSDMYKLRTKNRRWSSNRRKPKSEPNFHTRRETTMAKWGMPLHPMSATIQIAKRKQASKISNVSHLTLHPIISRFWPCYISLCFSFASFVAIFEHEPDMLELAHFN